MCDLSCIFYIYMVKCYDENYHLKGGVCVKRCLTVLFALVLILGAFCIPVSAESTASRIESYSTVTSEGDCVVSMTVTLRLDSTDDSLSFPLPLSANDISVNGSAARTTTTASAIEVDISRYTGGLTGEFRLSFDYVIPEAVKVVKINDERVLQLEIPMLCGFSFPVQQLDFVITMPTGSMPNQPDFTSVYRQNSIESDLTLNTLGNQITGSTKNPLNDHEGITMTMIVSQEMFPTVSTYIREGNPELVPMLIFVGVALLYWLIFLRTWPLIRSRSVSPPQGITAGELGCRLTLSGGDLTMMVFSWAQLGYVLIQLDGNGRVLLHKRMDMGNERNQFENKVFKLLFGSKRSVDATGVQYAKLCRKVATIVPQERSMCKPHSGNMKIFRGLCCGTQLFCGICVAMNMTGILVLQILLAMILAVFGAVSGWLIQDVAYRNHLRGKVPVYIGLVCILIWIVLGLLCGQVWIPLCSALGQLLIGYFAAYGGRRSDLGRHDAAQVLGLRHYLKHLPRGDINRLLMNDPDYFFNLAPFALAMGVVNPFARAFGRRKMDQCPYLVSRVHGKRTAEEWAKLLAQTADLMDARSRRMQVEKWIPVRFR